jgi:hypothetical protein
MTKRTVVAVAVVVTLLFGAVRPSPAHALSTAVLVVGSIAAFAGFVVAGTLLTTHRQGASSLQERHGEGSHAPGHMPEGAVRWGAHCRPTADGQPLLCW